MITRDTLAEVQRAAESDTICPSYEARDLHAHLSNIIRADQAYWAEDFVIGADTIARGKQSGEWLTNQIKESFAADPQDGFAFYIEAMAWARTHFAK